MSGTSVLVVEDDYMLREGLCETLEQEGFTVLGAINGREALAKMATFHPDLILSDIAMPEMDGYTFFKAVRSRPEWITIPFIFLTARGEKHDIMLGKDLGAEDYLVKPVTPAELFNVIRSRLARAQQLHFIQLQKSYEASLTVLANAIELRDRYTRGHVERVTAYALTIADRLGWRDNTRLEYLRFGGILHDIGKIHVHEKTLQKPGPLTEEEWVEIRQHPVKGAQMINGIPYLAPAILAIRHHHERWDGRGYPDGLAKEAIPVEARILALADSFDAMTSTRSYRPALSLSAAFREIQNCAGTRYDPGLVAVFEDAWKAGEIQSIYETLRGGGLTPATK